MNKKKIGKEKRGFLEKMEEVADNNQKLYKDNQNQEKNK